MTRWPIAWANKKSWIVPREFSLFGMGLRADRFKVATCAASTAIWIATCGRPDVTDIKKLQRVPSPLERQTPTLLQHASKKISSKSSLVPAEYKTASVASLHKAHNYIWLFLVCCYLYLFLGKLQEWKSKLSHKTLELSTCIFFFLGQIFIVYLSLPFSLIKLTPSVLITRVCAISAPWMTLETKLAKTQQRLAERKWRESGLTVHREVYAK